MYPHSHTLIALVCLAGSSAIAQTSTNIPVGTRLRFTYRAIENEQPGDKPRPFIARFARTRGDTVDAVDAANGDTLKLPLPHFDRVEMAASTYHPFTKAGIIGASLGLLAGAAYGYVHGTSVFVCRGVAAGCNYENRIGGAGGALRWGVVGAAAGLGTGLVVATSLRADRWVVITGWRK